MVWLLLLQVLQLHEVEEAAAEPDHLEQEVQAEQAAAELAE